MNFLPDISGALAVIDTFLIQHARDLNAATQAALLQASSQASPVDKMVAFGETLYALGAAASAEAKTAAAQVIEFAARYSWHGLGADGRGAGIVAALRRDLGEAAPAGGWPDLATDPAPRPDIQAALGLAPATIAPASSPLAAMPASAPAASS